MRVTASALFNSIALGGSKRIQFTVKVKEVSSYSDALDSGTWTDVTHLINLASFPSIQHSIEYEIGQFLSSRVSLESDGIQSWKTRLNVTHQFTLDVDELDDVTVVLG
ncbi:MAG: hypothetical protein EPO24_09390 [Bacteroidetes bacterium]|nr:MAG: hypothetical protein EPO24_09390 [Bacteroidota bacterium]